MRLLLLGLLLSGCASTAVTTVVVVRHAEKEAGDDPGLTPKGQARADGLAALLVRTAPAAIFATQYRRTQLTVQPLAEATQQKTQQVDAKSTAELARRILSEHRGQTVVVAGHSNTVNELIGNLGGPKLADLDESDYDNLFVLTVSGSKAKLLSLRYSP